MSRDPRSFNEPVERFLAPDDLDNLGRAVLALALELAVTMDRVLLLEDFIAAGDADARARCRNHQPSPSAQDAMSASRDRIIAAVVDALGKD